ncbi:MAG: hypothetical protein QOG54_736 [Actinomycetota bacterium]|jgi:hypothetical protein|nr:hypothetical protein [Actinomycetota bacterium]
MKAALLSSAAILVLLVAMGTTDSGTGGPITDPSGASGAKSALTVNPDNARPGDVVRVTFDPPPNQVWGIEGELRNVTGDRSELIAWTSGWLQEERMTTVWPSGDASFDSIGFQGRASWDWEVPLSLWPGTYELRKDAIKAGVTPVEERTVVYAGRFEVVP